MWYKNLYSHYNIELTWASDEPTKGLELIMVKDERQIDYNNVFHEDSDGRMWLEKPYEARMEPVIHTGKILWCLGCAIHIYARLLSAESCVTNISLSIYKDSLLIETIAIDESLFCYNPTVLVCILNIPTNLYELPVIDVN